MSSWMPDDPLVSKIVGHPILFAAVAVTSFAAAYVILPRVSVLWRSVAVRLGLSSQLNDKICTFITQHSKNMQEAEKNPSYAFSIINAPALVANSHRIAVGILPDDSLLADIKRSSLTKGENGAVRELAVLSVVEQFELDTEFDFISTSGQQKHFKSFAGSAGGFKQRSIHPCDDYCAVPLPVLHRAADQLQRYLADGLAVYVHCKSGKGRSACAVCAYLMKHQGLTCDDAVAAVKGSRSVASITSGKHYQALLQFHESIGKRQ